MTLATDIADDMSFMDGYTAMTLGPRNPTTSNVGCYGIPHPITKQQVALYGGLGIEPTDISVSLSATTLSGTVPKHLDILTVGGVDYVVQLVETLTMATRYQLLARKAV